jgi:RNA polymerase sigma-70 factor (ECF subfamily)
VADLSATRWSIVNAAQQGDVAAIRTLAEKYRPAVVAWLERRGLGADAEDLAQEALLGILGPALARADRRAGRFRGLVFAVARNIHLKHLEREGAQKRGPGRTVQLGTDHDVPDPAAPPDDEFDREWLQALVQSALARLGREHPQYLEAVRRFVLDEQPQARIAEEVGASVGAVKKLVLRGKKKLAAYLREEVWAYAASPEEYETELRLLSQLLGEDVRHPLQS